MLRAAPGDPALRLLHPRTHPSPAPRAHTERALILPDAHVTVCPIAVRAASQAGEDRAKHMRMEEVAAWRNAEIDSLIQDTLDEKRPHRALRPVLGCARRAQPLSLSISLPPCLFSAAACLCLAALLCVFSPIRCARLSLSARLPPQRALARQLACLGVAPEHAPEHDGPRENEVLIQDGSDSDDDDEEEEEDDDDGGRRRRRRRKIARRTRTTSMTMRCTRCTRRRRTRRTSTTTTRTTTTSMRTRTRTRTTTRRRRRRRRALGSLREAATAGARSGARAVQAQLQEAELEAKRFNTVQRPGSSEREGWIIGGVPARS